MNRRFIPRLFTYTISFLLMTGLSSCLTASKMDAHVAKEYGNQLPKPKKMKQDDIMVKSAFAPKDISISNTVRKTSKVLPLIVYWQFDYRHTCTLNPEIALSHFSNTINSSSGKIAQKLNGKELELVVEQAPAAFALVDKAHILLLISWDRIYIEPDQKDLIVSYKVRENNGEVKTGSITIKNQETEKNIRFAQSWRSSSSEYLARYNANVTAMSKAFVNKLLEEL